VSSRLALLLVLGAVACSANVSRNVDESDDLPSCAFDLSEEGFIQELLDPRATPRTPAFDDYTDGSYHVDKLGLLAALREKASGDPRLLGLTVAGPYGGLWAYEVALFVREDSAVRVNWLVMPHARITYKATKELSLDEFARFRDSVLSSPVLVNGLPRPDSGQTSEDLEWSFGLVAEFWDSAPPRAVYLPDTWSFTGSARLEAASALMDNLLEGSLATYSSDIPQELGSNLVCTDPCWP